MDLKQLVKSCEEYSFPNCENCPCFSGECLYLTELRNKTTEEFEKE